MRQPFVLYERLGHLTGGVVHIHDRKLDGWLVLGVQNHESTR